MPPWKTQTVNLIETQMDDITGQEMGYLIQRLLDAGALDALAIPVVMKKGRPGFLLQALCTKQRANKLCSVIFDETPTLGIRIGSVTRRILPRRERGIRTRYGKIRVKEGKWRGHDRVVPEFSDLIRVAGTTGQPLRRIKRELNE